MTVGRLSYLASRWRMLAGIILVLGGVACGSGKSTTAGNGDGDGHGDGDGDKGDGDGDTGDGDGDKGDGDGDTSSGDGDTSSGDGDTSSGDGDSSSGDGDTSSGDGDAPNMPNDCLPDQTDNVAAAVVPPNGLDPSQVPQFVMFGFDDNLYADGLNWVVDDLFNGRKNSDGSQAKVTFFVIAGGSTTPNGAFIDAGGHQTQDDVFNAWKHAFDAGHEIGGHTWDHADGMGQDAGYWADEVGKANTFFKSKLGLDSCQLAGWRFPFLHFDEAGFAAVASSGYRYDTSVEFGYDWWIPPGSTMGSGNTSPETGKHYYWPFTLDNGFPETSRNNGVGKHPGMWEFLASTFNEPVNADASTVRTYTALDYNIWKAYGATQQPPLDPPPDFCKTLKFTFDQRYNGNRAPFSAGMHSDNYSLFNKPNDDLYGKDGKFRRAALKCFVDYIQTKPDTRIVTFKQVIDWMRDPKPL
jgi:hypothetical protein